MPWGRRPPSFAFGRAARIVGSCEVVARPLSEGGEGDMDDRDWVGVGPKPCQSNGFVALSGDGNSISFPQFGFRVGPSGLHFRA